MHTLPENRLTFMAHSQPKALRTYLLLLLLLLLFMVSATSYAGQPSQIDRVEMTIGEQVFVSEQAPSAVFYGEVTLPMLLAISQAKLPAKVLIYSEGQTIEASFSEIGSSAALCWIGAIISNTERI
jgi:hypothetical protein